MKGGIAVCVVGGEGVCGDVGCGYCVGGEGQWSGDVVMIVGVVSGGEVCVGGMGKKGVMCCWR